MKLFENKRALVGMLRLVNEDAREFTLAMEGMEDKLGSANAAFEKMNESAARQFDIFNAKLNVTLIEFGDAILPAVIEGMNKLAPSVEAIGKSIAENSDVWTGMAEGIGIAVEAGLGLLNLLNEIGKVIEKITLPSILPIVRFLGKRLGAPQAAGPEELRDIAGDVGGAITSEQIAAAKTALKDLRLREAMKRAAGSQAAIDRAAGRQGATDRDAGRQAAIDRGVERRGEGGTSIHTGANYFDAKSSRGRMEEGAFSDRVAS